MVKKIKSTILLTGAGFTKSFGGYLADEMWGAIFNQPEINKHPRLRACLLKNISFEDAYAEVWDDPSFSIDEQTAFSDALGRAYDEMDKEIQKFTPQGSAACVDLIKLFAGSGEEEQGFIFSLNQDLFIERFLNVDRRFDNRAWLDMPGLDHTLWFSNNAPRKDLDIEYLFTLAEAQQVAQLRDRFWSEPGAHLSYFKLHGSDNWHDSKISLGITQYSQKSSIRAAIYW